MANIKQQKKRVLIAQRQRLENLRYKSSARTLLRALQDNVNLGDKEASETSHKQLVQLLDRAASRRALHPNTVARKKSRAARILISEPVKEAKAVRRGKKGKAPLRTSKKKATTEGAAAAAATEATTTDAPETGAETATETAAKKPAAKKAPAAKKPAAKDADKDGTKAKADAKAPAKKAAPKAKAEPKADDAPAADAVADEKSE